MAFKRSGSRLVQRKTVCKKVVRKKIVLKKIISKKIVCQKQITKKQITKKQPCQKPICKKQIGKKTPDKKRVCERPAPKKPIRKKHPKHRSAFKAIAGFNQRLYPDELTKVWFQVEEFDLNNEYHPAASIFCPKCTGVYSLTASVSFQTVDFTPVTAHLQIRINGVPKMSDQENVSSRRGIIDASGIIQLKAGDKVEVFVKIYGERAEILGGLATRFEGARIN
ncbi:hypothetical protein [Paenibacillus ehimensis]|uniref:hypothetical protein n=1 Tax=Paenibacillus ehimensis TaxID=79264 RepID=UPI000FDA92C8|nr:hypothetical protein [Paenibacillus ehimensis]